MAGCLACRCYHDRTTQDSLGRKGAIEALRRAQADQMAASADLDWVEGRGDGDR